MIEIVNNDTIRITITNPSLINVTVSTAPSTIPVIIGVQGPPGPPGPPGSGSTIQEVTYAQLKNLVDSGVLIPEQEYRITDFYTEYTQDGFQWILEWDENFSYGYGMVIKRPDSQYQWIAWRSLQNGNVGNVPEETEGVWWERAFAFVYRTPVEPIIVRAISNSEISPIARSEQYPFDDIYYDINSTGKSGISPKGWITRRVDRVNNIDVPFDWRHIKFIAFGQGPNWWRAMYPVESGDKYYSQLVDAVSSKDTGLPKLPENIFVTGGWWNSVIRGGGFRILVENGWDNFLGGYDDSKSFININVYDCYRNFGVSTYGVNIDSEIFSYNNVLWIWMVFLQGGQFYSCNFEGMYYAFVYGGRLRNCDLRDVSNSILVFDDEYNVDLRYVRDIYEVRTKKYYKRISGISSYVCNEEDKIILVDASGGDITITLMDTNNVSGNEVVIRRIDNSANTVTIQGYGEQLIEGQQSYDLLLSEKVRLLADGTDGKWWII